MLINKDHLLEQFSNRPPDAMIPVTAVRQMIQDAPTIDAVKHGKYIGTEWDGYANGSPVYYEWKCSECGCIFEDDEPWYNYCPNCGADMRERKE